MSSAQSLDAVPIISPTPTPTPPPPPAIPRRNEHRPATASDPRALRRNIRRTRLGEEVGKGHLLAFLLFGSCDADGNGNSIFNASMRGGDARYIVDAHELEGRGGEGENTKSAGRSSDEAERNR
jgi:hypothetical protein